jgi:hypothetical protein
MYGTDIISHGLVTVFLAVLSWPAPASLLSWHTAHVDQAKAHVLLCCYALFVHICIQYSLSSRAGAYLATLHTTRQQHDTNS